MESDVKKRYNKMRVIAIFGYIAVIAAGIYLEASILSIIIALFAVLLMRPIVVLTAEYYKKRKKQGDAKTLAEAYASEPKPVTGTLPSLSSLSSFAESPKADVPLMSTEPAHQEPRKPSWVECVQEIENIASELNLFKKE